MSLVKVKPKLKVDVTAKVEPKLKVDVTAKVEPKLIVDWSVYVCAGICQCTCAQEIRRMEIVNLDVLLQ